MNKEEANYIRNYFSNLMTDNEKLALKHHMYTYKTSDKPRMKKMMIERGWISEQPEVKDMLINGYEAFELKVGQRILSQYPEKIFFNKCSKCNSLARTPYARQCKNCGFSWHDIVQAKLQLKTSFQITERQFFLSGKITKGEVQVGQFMDLTMLGLNRKPKIEAIEFVLSKKDGTSQEDIALGTSELSEEEKEYIKRIGSFGTPFDIVTK